MFQVDNVILSDEVALSRFACDLSRCKGACCVVGDAGAPVSHEEIPVLRKAYDLLKPGLRQRAVEVVENEGLIKTDENGESELNCTDGKECVFVTYEKNGVAVCSIHKAYEEGKLNWKKPISCHLFPIRIKKIGNQDFVNFEYVSSLCSSACDNGREEGIYLSDFLEEPLVRQYGRKWYLQFKTACKEIRSKKEVDRC